MKSIQNVVKIVTLYIVYSIEEKEVNLGFWLKFFLMFGFSLYFGVKYVKMFYSQ